MNLPNYFLADLPPEATLSAAMITEACQTLKRNRDRYLAHASSLSRIKLLSTVAASWLELEFPFRRLALDQGPTATGFSRATIASGLETFFKGLTRDNLEGLLEQDLGDAGRLDGLAASALEEKTSRAAVALAPELLVHITAGSLPNPALMSIVLGVLLRSAQFVKCAAGTSLFPRLFAHSLYAAEPKLGACLEVAQWPGGNIPLEKALFEEADCVTATGTDETLEAIRSRLPARIRFVGYGSRVSFAFVSGGVLSGHNARKVAARAAADVAAWDQHGCLAPHVVYVENGGSVTPEHFAEMLAGELARREETEPRGTLSGEAETAINSRRSFYDLRASHPPESPDQPETRLWRSENSTAWTVVYETDPLFQRSCLNRFIYVKNVPNLASALQGADGVRGKVSTVGLAATEDKAEGLALELARWGASRVCPLGQMQNPPLAWRRHGRPALAELTRWTDWEM
ncbi:Acyl-CoA reductase [Verrucomicrobia bacterium]|nr:Acyl-CoA reductase [Verrucomicrobiota bacterium]